MTAGKTPSTYDFHVAVRMKLPILSPEDYARLIKHVVEQEMVCACSFDRKGIGFKIYPPADIELHTLGDVVRRLRWCVRDFVQGLPSVTPTMLSDYFGE